MISFVLNAHLISTLRSTIQKNKPVNVVTPSAMNASVLKGMIVLNVSHQKSWGAEAVVMHHVSHAWDLSVLSVRVVNQINNILLQMEHVWVAARSELTLKPTSENVSVVIPHVSLVRTYLTSAPVVKRVTVWNLIINVSQTGVPTTVRLAWNLINYFVLHVAVIIFWMQPQDVLHVPIAVRLATETDPMGVWPVLMDSICIQIIKCVPHYVTSIVGPVKKKILRIVWLVLVTSFIRVNA